MELDGTHIVVAGATGALGGAPARALDEAGAELALAGRDAARLGAIGDELGVPTHMDTSFGDRPIFGRAPELPEPRRVQVVVDAVMEAIRPDLREIARDLKARSLVTA